MDGELRQLAQDELLLGPVVALQSDLVAVVEVRRGAHGGAHGSAHGGAHRGGQLRGVQPPRLAVLEHVAAVLDARHRVARLQREARPVRQKPLSGVHLGE